MSPRQSESRNTRAAAGEFVRYEARSSGRRAKPLLSTSLSLSPSRNAKGEVVFLVPEGRDINELKRAEADSSRQNAAKAV